MSNQEVFKLSATTQSPTAPVPMDGPGAKRTLKSAATVVMLAGAHRPVGSAMVFERGVSIEETLQAIKIESERVSKR